MAFDRTQSYGIVSDSSPLLFVQGGVIYKSTDLSVVSDVTPYVFTNKTPSSRVITGLGTLALLGDSRTALYSQDITNPIQSVQGRCYIAWANALLGKPFTILAMLGVSGLRSDQFISQGLAAAIATGAEYLSIGPAVANDIGQAASGYTDVSGRVVNITNVVGFAAGNIKSACQAATAAGMKVIVSTEWGSSSGWSTTLIACLFQFNEALRYIAANLPNVYLWDGTKDLWNDLASDTAIAYRANFMVDNLHPGILGAFAGGSSFATWFGAAVRKQDYLGMNQADNPTTNSQSLIANGLFNILTGGSISGGAVLTSGTIPSLWGFTGAATTSIVVTSAANANGYGNDLTLAITASAADSCTFSHNSFGALLALTDKITAAIEVDVAVSSSNFSVWSTLQMATNTTNPKIYDLWADRTAGVGNGPATAYKVTLLHPNIGFQGGSSISTAKHLINLDFTAAGSATVTLRRAAVRKQITV